MFFSERKVLERLGKQYQGFVSYLEGLELPEFAQMVSDSEFDGSIITATDEVLIDLGMENAIDRLRFRVLFQRELLKKTSEVAKMFPVEKVASFFRERKLIADCAKAVEENGIDGEMLLLADKEVLEQLGVRAAGVLMIKNRFQDKVFQSLSSS